MFKIEVEQEADGRWIAEVPELPGVLAYGASREAAVTRAQTLALRVLADRLEHGEELPQVDAAFSTVAKRGPRRGSPAAILALVGTLSDEEADAISKGAEECAGREAR